MFNEIAIPPYLINEHYDDRFFDVIDAVAEARHMYFEGNNLLERLLENKGFIIGETGFGVGRVFVALLEYLENSGLKDLKLTYNSVELHPLKPERILLILNNFKDKLALSTEFFISEYEKLDFSKTGWQQIIFNRPFGKITLNLYLGEALEMVNSLPEKCDTWFLDGHGPRKNPLIWRTELLNKIAEMSKTGGTFSTFTVAVTISNDLKNAGFKVEQFPGFGRKRAFLKGIKL